MTGACEMISRQHHRGSLHGAGGRATTLMRQAVDAIDVPVELARPVVAELWAGCLRGPVLRHAPRRWTVLTATRRRAGFALPESLIQAGVRLYPEGTSFALPSNPGGATTGSGDCGWVLPPERNPLLPPFSVVIALLERVAQARPTS